MRATTLPYPAETARDPRGGAVVPVTQPSRRPGPSDRTVPTKPAREPAPAHDDDDPATRNTEPVQVPETGEWPARAPGKWPPEGNVVDARYRVMKELGRGGMGSVVLGEDLLLHRPVAIKFARPGAAPGDLLRFRREAQLLASLDHPNVVRVYRDGEHEGRPYFVMEYLQGQTLDGILGANALDWLPLDVVLGWISQVCDALSAVHAFGFLHRDVKPGNVMVVRGTRAVLLDFGLAQHQLQREHDRVSGTPHYLAPEDIRGRPLYGPDAARSDVYALGVTLFELLCGRPPFDGPTPQHVMEEHLRRSPPPLRDARPDLPASVENVVRRALAKNPEGRPATAADLKEELWRARGQNGAPEPISDDVVTVPMRLATVR